MDYDERLISAYRFILNKTLESIPYTPKYRHDIVLFSHRYNMAYFDFQNKVIGLNRTLGLNLEKVEDMVAHEVVHLIQAERDPEIYLRMKTWPDSGLFRKVFHDTLLNCLELEARLFEKRRILTLDISGLMLSSRNDFFLTPFEWLILNPVQAMKLYQSYSNWGYLTQDIDLQEYADEWINQCTTTELVPEANILLRLLEESLSKLREIAGDNVSNALLSRQITPASIV